MEKLLINLFVPVVQKRFDLLVPQDVPIQKLTQVICEGVKEQCSERYRFSGREILMISDFKKPLNPALCLCDYYASNGMSFVLL